MAEEMGAGEDLDIAVAERVMGIDRTARTPDEIAEAVFTGYKGNSRELDGEHHLYHLDGNEHIIFLTSKRVIAYYQSGKPTGYASAWEIWEDREDRPWRADIEAHVAAWRKSVPKYSTDIAAAWLVVEKLNLSAFQVEGTWFAGYACGYRLDRDGGGGDFGVMHLATADTAPLAICRAALAIVTKKER